MTPALRSLPSRLAEPGRALVMGVLNVTPDSFSDGGRFLEPGAAVAHGEAMLRAGADLVDVGGESTRPGAQRVTPEEEMRRVLPVVRALSEAGAVVSIDTMRATTADAALHAGASIVNDVSGGLADPAILNVVEAARVPYVLMHWRGHSRQMQARATYADVVREVCDELVDRLKAVTEAGVDEEQVVLDPGLGFAKTPEHNWGLLAHLDALHALGRPVLVGASRKSFLGKLLAEQRGGSREGQAGERVAEVAEVAEGTAVADVAAVPAADREAASVAVAALAAAAGAWCVRVHDVGPALDAVRVAAAVSAARDPSSRQHR